MKKVSFTLAAFGAVLLSTSASYADSTTGQTTTTAAPYPYSPTGQVAEHESTTEHTPNTLMMKTGVGIFVVSYGSSVVAAAVSPRDEDKNLFIPVVGPWLDLGDRDCATRSCGNDDVAKAMIISSGIAQGVGVLLGVGSLFVPESTTTRTRNEVTSKAEVTFTPVSYGSGAGLGAVGRF